jgi:serine/threonine-protein kinase
MPLAEGEVFAGYTILRRLGSGGMGEVYLAQHPRLPRSDALKVLGAEATNDAEYRQRFNREADVAAALWHPHIVGVHDRGEFDGQLWISMDYVEGIDASRLLAQKYPNGMPADGVCKIVAAVADALDYAHERGLLHRDVKPANILLTEPESGERRILLADFGIARRLDEASGLTATNMTVGTVLYAAPEQLMGQQIDGRADQYALAASAYQLLTGAPPFSNTNPAVVISGHLSGPVPRLADRRPELADFDPALSRALAKDPAARFDRCADFARALADRAQSAEDVAAALAPTRAAHVAAPPKRSLLRPAIVVPAVLAVLLIVAATVAGIELLGKRAPSPAAPTRSRAALPPTVPGPARIAPAPPVNSENPAPPPAGGAPVAVIGAICGPPGTTGVTGGGSTAYCSLMQGIAPPTYAWSLHPGDVASPGPEPRVRICMDQTGQTRLRCLEEIRASEGAPPR